MSASAPPGEPGPDGAGERAAELIAAASHEIRQPLASIRGFTEMLLAHWEELTEPDKLAMLSEILHESQRVGHLVDELMDGARLDPGPLRLRLGPTDLAQVVRRAVRGLETSYPALHAEVEVGPDLGPVEADAFKLEQVVANILENACKYGSPTDVRVAASSTSGPGYEGAGDEVTLTIADNGPGIDAQDLPHVTDKFYRSAQLGGGGLGLGLWISKGIIEAHGGRLVASSEPGQGTSVSFTIPRRPGPKTGKLAGS